VKVATTLDYAAGFKAGVADVVEMEKAGLDLVWVPEAYGFDAPSLMGYIAARTTSVEIGSSILPIFTRTPALLAMTSAGLDSLSDGRFHLGLGASGPQVIEGFHGVPFTSPLGRTREIIQICREVWRREVPLVHEGKNYTMPLSASSGKPLKMLTHPLRSSVPIWLAALGEKNVELAAEMADGWIPFFFIPERESVFTDPLAAGRARRVRDLKDLMISAGGLFAVGEGDETIEFRNLERSRIALYVGGMGAKGKNFYNELAVRYGFEEAAAQIQDLYIAGKKREAEIAVPEEFLKLVTLCGPKSFVAERIAAFRSAGVTHLQIRPCPQPGQTKATLIEIAKTLAD
jgi:F420-dependent oxidoreductase-like protein